MNKHLKTLREVILSTKLEIFLLLLYLVAFAMVVRLKMGFADGSSVFVQDQYWTSHDFTVLLSKHFMAGELDKVNSVDTLYDFVDKLQNKRLWVPVD